MEKNSNLRVGDLVVHKFFGNGEVAEIDKTNDAIKVKFEEYETPRTLSLSSKIEIQSPKVAED